jgi:DNA polymerase-3 subunit alpha
MRVPTVEDWAPTERLAEEFAAVGFYLSGHPLDAYAGSLKRKRVYFHADVLRSVARGGAATVRMAGCVMRRQERKSARGNRFAFVELSDPTGLWEVTVFSDALARARDLLEPGRNVVLSVDVEADGDQPKFLCRGVAPVEEVTADAASVGLRIHVDAAEALESVLRRMKMGEGRGSAPVELVLWSDALGAEVEIALPGRWPLDPAVRSAIKMAPGVRDIEDF